MPVFQESFSKSASTTWPWTVQTEESHQWNAPYSNKEYVPIDFPSSMDSTSREDDENSMWNGLLDTASRDWIDRINNNNDDVSMKIVGGTPVYEGEFPFYVVAKGNRLCGGSLIAPDIVMSAAHCGLNMWKNNGVYIGGTNIRPYNGEFFPVDDAVIIPTFDPTWYENDIMLIKLSTPSNVKPVSLNFNSSIPLNTNLVGEILTTVGHGLTSERGSFSNELLEVDVPYVDPNVCSFFFGASQETKICAGGVPGKDSCSGDSGGPLLTADNVQVGIVSSGYGCASDLPALYTRISNYEEWIVETACAMTSVNPSFCPGGSITPEPTTLSPTLKPISMPRPEPTSAPTIESMDVSTIHPTNSPTSEPTSRTLLLSPPTSPPTSAPIPAPTSTPTSAPTHAPISLPTSAPSPKPTLPPTSAPTPKPTSAVPTTLPPTTLAPVTFAPTTIEESSTSLSSFFEAIVSFFESFFGST